MRRIYLVTTSAGVCIPVRGYRAALRFAACLNVPASIIRWKLARR